MRTSKSISLQEASKVLSYDPETGLFVRLHRNKPPKFAGHKNDRGYILIGVNNKSYFAHRLAWLFVHGSFPEGLIDHINGDPSDNRIINLRLTDNMGNNRNQKNSRRNKYGYRGVDKSGKKYRAGISFNNTRVHSEVVDTPLEAAKIYDQMARNYFGEFAVLNFPEVKASELRNFIKGVPPMREVLLENGKLTLSPIVKNPKRRPRTTDWDAAYDLYKRGLNLTEISKRLVTTRQNVQHIIKAMKE